MPLESAPQSQLGRIDPSALIGRPDTSIVTPNSTAMLSDAFRQGFITADDITERIGERAKAKKELELATTKQGLQDVQDPELQAAKRNVSLAQGAQAGNVLANSDLAQQAQAEGLKAAILDAQLKPGGHDEMQKALTKAGYPVAIDAGVGLTDANKREIEKRFSVLVDYVKQQQEATDRVAKTETKEFSTKTVTPTGEVHGSLPVLRYQNQDVDPETYKQWVQQHDTLAKTPFSAFYNLRSGTATAAPKPGAVSIEAKTTSFSPEAIQSQRSELAGQGIDTSAAAMSDQQVENLVQQRRMESFSQPKPTIEPSTAPALGDVMPGIGRVTGTVEGKTDATIRMTGEQQKSLAQATLTREQLDDLASSYDTLSTESPSLIGPVMGRLSAFTAPQNWNTNYAGFMRAKTAILANLAKGIYHETGVLSDKDIARYEGAMPSAKDTPEVARTKLQGVTRDIFNSIVGNIETMKGQGQAVSPIVQQIQQSAQQELNKLQPAAAPSAAAGARVKVSLPGRGAGEYDPATGLFYPAKP